MRKCLVCILLFSFAWVNADEWMKTYGGGDARCVRETSDGGYIVIGNKEADIWLIKTDSIGDTLWTRIIDFGLPERIWWGQQTFDKGYIAVGECFMGEIRQDDVWVIKVNSLGDTLWTKRIDGYGPDYYRKDCGYYIQQTSDSGYIIVGETYYYRIWLLKLSSSGDTLWTKAFDDSASVSGLGWGRCVQQTFDGGYVITGGDMNLFVIKVDSLGNMVRKRDFGREYGFFVQQTADSGYIIGGKKFPGGAWLIKLAADVGEEERWRTNLFKCVSEDSELFSHNNLYSSKEV